jgi:hypothetical protein
MRTANLWISALFLASACSGGDSSGAVDSGNGGDPADSGAAPVADASLDKSVLDGWCSDQDADFSFFVTSMDALWKLSGSAPDDLEGGFGGDFGGLSGADEICQTIAAATGHGDQTWHAFLSATDDGSGAAVHASDRIGAGPWSDATGRLVASGNAGVLSGDRPDGDAQSVQDLPDECGVPLTLLGDAHDVVTASNRQGRLADTSLESTCNDWTSSDGAVGSSGGMMSSGRVICGHSFPREGSGSFGANWISDHGLRGCGKGANLIQNGPGEGTCIGCSGGYGALYCFAL